MERKFLKDLGVEDTVIDKIMAEHGKTVEKYKNDADSLKTKDTEITNLKEQLKTANKQIEDFKGMDVENIKKTADEYKAKYETAEKTAKAEVEKIKYESALNLALEKAGSKNSKALKGLLDLEKIKVDENGLTGFDEQLTKIKEENAYLFDTDPNSTSLGMGGSGEKLSGVEQAFFAKNPELKQD